MRASVRPDSSADGGVKTAAPEHHCRSPAPVPPPPEDGGIPAERSASSSAPPLVSDELSSSEQRHRASGGSGAKLPQMRDPPLASPSLSPSTSVSGGRSRTNSRERLACRCSGGEESSQREETEAPARSDGGECDVPGSKDAPNTEEEGGKTSNNSEAEPRDSEGGSNTEVDMYTQLRHDPGDGKRSTEEAWREYLNREEEFSYVENSSTIRVVDGLNKLITAADPRFGNTDENDDRWEDVRRFLEEATNDEKKEAAGKCDERGRNVLHLASGARPPKDVVEGIIGLLIDKGRSDRLKATDKNGWLPIHHACAFHASEEVVRLLIDKGGSETLTTKAKEDRLPTHFACANNASEQVIRLLIDKGGSDTLLAADKNGWLPIHHACSFHASEEVVCLLIDEGGSDTLKAADIIGFLPIHSACLNNASEEVVRLLIDKGGSDMLTKADKNGWLPIHCACENDTSEEVVCLLIDKGERDTLMTANEDGRIPLYYALQNNNTSDAIINLFLDNMTEDSWKVPRVKRDVLLTCFLDATPVQREICLHHPKVNEALNRRFTARPVLAVMMIDFYMQVVLIVAFSFASFHCIDRGGGIETWQLSLLILSMLWFGIREMIQLLYLKSFRYYATDIWNWLDWGQITLVSVSLARMNSSTSISDNDSIRTLLTVTVGIVWFALLGVMKNFLYGIAIFVASLQQILIKLMPFTVVTAVTTAAFVFMLHTATSNTAYCDEEKWYCGTLGQLFADLSAFVLSLADIGVQREMLQESATAVGVLYFFGFFIALVFLNILIAKISNIFSETESSGERFFWENRLSVVAETESFLRFSTFKKAKKEDFAQTQRMPILHKMNPFFADNWEWEDIVFGLFLAEERNQSDKNLVIRLMIHVAIIACRALVSIMLLCFFALGCASLGALWPKWMTEAMFFGRTDDDSAKRELTVTRWESEKSFSKEHQGNITASVEERIIEQNNEKFSAMEEMFAEQKRIIEDNNAKISAMEEEIKHTHQEAEETTSAILKQQKTMEQMHQETEKAMSAMLKQLEEMSK